MENVENGRIDKITLRIILGLNSICWLIFFTVLIGRWHVLHSYARFYAVLVLFIFPQLWYRLIRERVSEAALALLSIASFAVFLLFIEGM